MSFTVCIPTYNSQKKLELSIPMLNKQTLKPDAIWVVDSSSSDATTQLCQQHGLNVHIIPKENFNHGGTRNLFLTLADSDYYLFLTDDAIPANENTFRNILLALENNPTAGMAYGRQLPHQDANVFASHARLFNYSSQSLTKKLSDAPNLGIKTPFCSNSFALYRKSALMQVGLFPSNTILSEDTYVAARMLLAGYHVEYVADAMVYHSHNYTLWQEFKRYFDIGVFYGNEKWIKDIFGTASTEGGKFLCEELKYLHKNKHPIQYPEWILRNFLKALGYKLGGFEKKIPLQLKSKFSMHPAYWK